MRLCVAFLLFVCYLSVLASPNCYDLRVIFRVKFLPVGRLFLVLFAHSRPASMGGHVGAWLVLAGAAAAAAAATDNICARNATIGRAVVRI